MGTSRIAPRRVPFALIVALALALVSYGGTSVAETGAASDQPPRPLVTSEGDTQRAVLGGYCWSSRSRPICTAGTGRRSRAVVGIRPGGRVVVDTRLEATSVRFALFRRDRRLARGAAAREDGSGRRWMIAFRRDGRIGRARNLELDVTYPQGRVSSSIRVVRVVVVPRIVGMPESAAECALKRRHLRWRYKGDDRVRSRPIAPCDGSFFINPDPRVLSQHPAPGTRVKPRTVVVVDNECTARPDSAPPCA